MPLWIIPDRKLSVADMREAMRDHYEGTPLSVDNDLGGGVWNMPYRPTPLRFKVDGKDYFNERPISTQQSSFVYVSQMRSWLPRQIGGCFWFANDEGNMCAFVPIYCGNPTQPECFNTPGADAVTFSDKNAFWVCNWVSNMVYPRYAQMFPSLKAVRDSLDMSYDQLQQSIEQRALDILNSQGEQAAVKYLTDYSAEKGAQMLSRWRQLATYLIVKYNDMVIKPEKDGKFERTETGMGARPARPGYPESVARQLVKQTGDKFAVPEE